MRLSEIYWRTVTAHSRFRVGFVPQAGHAAVCVHVVWLCVHAGHGAWSVLSLWFRGTISPPQGLLCSSSSSSIPSSLSFVHWGMERMVLPQESECVWVRVMLTVIVSSVVS